MRAHLMRKVFTAQEYFGVVEQSLTRCEYIDGVIYDIAGGTEDHTLVGANVIGAFVARLRGRGCRAYSSDLRVYSPVVNAYVYPDASIVCGSSERSDVKGDHQSVKNPVVIVEVVSDGSDSYDRTDKVAIYKSIPSVRDYLIVDPYDRTVEHHARDDAGAWSLAVVREGDVALVGVAIALPVAEVFADLPTAHAPIST